MAIVTIGMPVYNDVDFVEESIKSILNQSFSDFTLIISDDGATDGSELICEKYAKIDKRIIYIRQKENIGISKNMKFLLNEAKSDFFMWAGDDDLLHKDFIKICLNLLYQNNDATVAFSKFDLIDDNGITFFTDSNPNFNNKSPFIRISNLIKKPSDAFGYGLFRTKNIKNVEFPTWWWPNRKTPYNNIFPTLCFYLASGNYVEESNQVLFFKRIKGTNNINHKTIGQGRGLIETFAFIIRRFNLVTFSAREIRRANSIILMIKLYPKLFYYWFIISSFNQFKLLLSSLSRKFRRISK